MLFNLQVIPTLEHIGRHFRLLNPHLRPLPHLFRRHRPLFKQHKRKVKFTTRNLKTLLQPDRTIITRMRAENYLPVVLGRSAILVPETALGLVELLPHERGQFLRSELAGQYQDLGACSTRAVLPGADR